MITAIDKNTALVLIDLQKGVTKMDVVHPIKNILEKSALLVNAFSEAELPIVIVNVIHKNAAWLKSRKYSNNIQSAVNNVAASTDFAEIVEEIKTQSSDIFITKQTWSA